MHPYTLFDIIGPRIVGPSSSHTAGAARLGNVARRVLGQPVCEAEITLYGSFAKTGKGHGTDKAILAGLLGFAPDDLRIRTAYEEARATGLEVQVQFSAQEAAHPNTARIRAKGADGRCIDLVGVSLGGGLIEVRRLNGMEVIFRCEYPTLLVFHQDQPGVIRKVTEVLDNEQVNIAFMRVMRNTKWGNACMILETDNPVPPACVEAIRKMHPVIREVCAL